MARPIDSHRRMSRLGAAGIFLLLLSLFAYLSPRIVSSLDYVNSDFFSLWLAARMTWSNQDPYDPGTWIGEHQALGADWISDDAFLYPIGLAVALAPLGLLGLYEAFVAWVFLSLLMILLSVLLLLLAVRRGPDSSFQAVIPIILGTFAFRPVVVTVRNGQLGSLLLMLVVLALWLWERERWLLGGVLIGAILVKPSLGIPLGLLIMVWTLVTGRWRATIGLGLGVACVLGLGWLRDPHWIDKYIRIVSGKASATLGYAPSLWGWVGLACRDVPTCVVEIGLLLTVLVLSAVMAVFLMRRGNLAARLAVAIAIPAALLVTPYIWAYDQILLIAPIVLLALEMKDQGYPYIATAPILLFFSLASLLLIVVATSIGRDAWSAFLSLLVLVGSIYLSTKRPERSTSGGG